MPSLIPGYEYDIFISYRHKDNKYDGWVTEFVSNLRKELEATFKEEVSIYFDENPHDGLLETHDVDDSLKDKLKCLIFIPIISQTYCDPKSFAWKNEFLVFKKIAIADLFGLKIKVANGNVASRVLPVKIHDLDAEDTALFENELGGVLRPIEFIYKEAGVIRPLKTDDSDEQNQNKTKYRNQINKVARAVKELISGIQHPNGPAYAIKQATPLPSVSNSFRKKVALAAFVIGALGLLSFAYYYYGSFGSKLEEALDRSIAVLPFENMNHDPEQDYFSNGIAEDILNHLTKISDLRVKSRTSTLQYKDTQRPIAEIGKELGVGNIVEGSVRRVGNEVRIVVQLIDAATDVHLWSETYDRELKDILTLQSEIAIEIANKLNARLTEAERSNIQKEASESITAYDYYLKAREVRNRFSRDRRETEDALQLVNHALQLDPKFAQALALKGRLWFDMRIYGIRQKTWQDSALFYAEKSIAVDRSSPDGYLVNGLVNWFLGDIKKSILSYTKAYEIAPNNSQTLFNYGVGLLLERKEKGAEFVLRSIENGYTVTDPIYYLSLNNVYRYKGDVAMQENMLKRSKSLSPGMLMAYIRLTDLYWYSGQHDKAIQEARLAEKINPTSQTVIDRLAWAYFNKNDLTNAEKYWSKYKEIEATFEDSTQAVPYRHRLAMVYLKTGRKKEADVLVHEDIKIRANLLAGTRSMGSWDNLGSVYYDLAVDHAYFGKDKIAVQYLDSAFQHDFDWPWGYRNDPMFSNLRDRDDFKRVLKKVDDYDEFRRRAFTKAINRMETNSELKRMLHN